ncbi:MAG: hypothetical protein E7236_06010 [Lachnospiraceae bacterium]|nr:hypothetical protein [Lachnospiraceae bacterium]
MYQSFLHDKTPLNFKYYKTAYLLQNVTELLQNVKHV